MLSEVTTSLNKLTASVLPHVIDSDPLILSLVKMRLLLAGKSAMKQKGSAHVKNTP